MRAASVAGYIDVDAVSKRFTGRGGDTAALDAVSASVSKGKMLALVGHSGSGKTTLLRCLAGLETPDAGRITIDGTTVFDGGSRVPAEQRNIGLIFQSYALWPHMTVAKNVEYSLRRRKLLAAKRKEKVDRYLDLVGCGKLHDRFPHEISGGQQQRVALARALVYEPTVMLFDEPLSNLDAALRERLRYQIRELQKTLGFTGVYVTHDLSEAFFVADEIAIMADGHILQRGTPTEVYDRPASPLVAGLVGSRNELRGVVDHGRLHFGDGLTIDVAAPDGPALLMVRPDGVAPGVNGQGPKATVVDRVNLGNHVEYLVELADGTRWRAAAPRGSAPIALGSTVGLTLRPEEVHVFPEPS